MTPDGILFLSFFLLHAAVSAPHVSRETFPFFGNHAATAASGRFTTVWLDEDMWDARVSHSNTHNKYMGHHIDIHSSARAHTPVDGALANNIAVRGGVRGAPGAMVMHMDFQGIVSARLRNALLLPMTEDDTAAHIEFYAPRVVTTGHWWEVAFTRDIVGAEHTAIPSVRNNLPAASRDVGGITAGPGIDMPVNSYNIIYAGASDLMCTYPYARFAVSTPTQKISAPARTRNDLIPFSGLHTTTTYSDALMHVVITVTHDSVAITLDYDDDGLVDYNTTFAVTPQQQLGGVVYVHLVGVAYQADHHPQLNQCNLGTERQLRWRNFAAWPVKYARTTSTDAHLINQDGTGWRSYDMRDTMRQGGNNANAQRIGPQKNVLTVRGYCMRSVMWPCDKPTKSPLLYFSIPDDASAGHIIYDIRTRPKDSYGKEYDFYFLIDGVHVFRPTTPLRLESQWFDEYLHTSIGLDSYDLDVVRLYHDNQGFSLDNIHTLQLVITKGVVEIDRISVELMLLSDDDDDGDYISDD